MSETPLTIQIEKAKNELRYIVNQISAKYDIPGCIMKIVLQSIIAEEVQQQLSLICEEINITKDEDKNAEDDS